MSIVAGDFVSPLSEKVVAGNVDSLAENCSAVYSGCTRGQNVLNRVSSPLRAKLCARFEKRPRNARGVFNGSAFMSVTDPRINCQPATSD